MIKADTIRKQVLHFHMVSGQPVKFRPEIPSEDRVRARLTFMTEEFLELLRAALNADSTGFIDDAERALMMAVRKVPLRVNMPEFIDALGDIDFISEGTRLEFGVNGKPVAEAIYEANMAKFPIHEACKGAGCDFKDYDGRVAGLPYCMCRDGHLVYLRLDGKIGKPTGWEPPNIAGVLLAMSQP